MKKSTFYSKNRGPNTKKVSFSQYLLFWNSLKYIYIPIQNGSYVNQIVLKYFWEGGTRSKSSTQFRVWQFLKHPKHGCQKMTPYPRFFTIFWQIPPLNADKTPRIRVKRNANETPIFDPTTKAIANKSGSSICNIFISTYRPNCLHPLSVLLQSGPHGDKEVNKKNEIIKKRWIWLNYMMDVNDVTSSEWWECKMYK